MGVFWLIVLIGILVGNLVGALISFMVDGYIGILVGNLVVALLGWTMAGSLVLVACVNRWELPGNYPVFTVAMIIYHYVEIIWRILVTPDFLYNIYDNEKYYTVEPVNIRMQSLINIIQERNWVITTKKG